MKRAMTEAEANQMRDMMASRRNRPRGEVWGTLVFAVGIGPAVYGGLALGLLALAGAALGWPIGLGYGVIAAGLVWLGFVIAGLRWVRAQSSARAADLALMAADLEKRVVLDEVHDVLEVKRLREPEHGMILMFLLLASGKVFVLYDYESAEDGPPLTPRTTLHLTTFPISKRRIWSFSGEPMLLTEPGSMGLPPDRWPEDEGWCRVKWENIERHFAG